MSAQRNESKVKGAECCTAGGARGIGAIVSLNY